MPDGGDGSFTRDSVLELRPRLALSSRKVSTEELVRSLRQIPGVSKAGHTATA
jgi:hypothetical protein